MTGRSTPEWIGVTPDAKIPPRVRLRVFETHGGKCALTGRKIQPGDDWDCDHAVALINGGEHRESNLQPVLRSAHRKKTVEDVKLKAKAARVKKKHLGIHQPKATLPGSRASKWKRTISGQTIRRDEV
jgi:5-methylcytosine-specific restriction enzyme A